MNSFMEWFRQPVVEALGWTLLHFLWQGAAIAVLLLLAQAALRKSPSNARYLAGCLALFFMAVSPVLTFGYLTKRREQSVIMPALTSVVSRETVVTFPTVASSPLEFEAVPVRIHAPSFVVRVENSLPWLVAIWLSVVSVLSLRLLAGWLYVSKIGSSATESIGDPWEEKLANLIRQLNVSRPIRLLKSALVEVPTVIGWFRPVILLPASSLTSLTPAQLEAIIAHELFHIRRHDYLVNLLQSAVETLLFYHPAVWWVSRQICQERENCCDDLTVKICGDRIAYAKALATLEELRSRPLQLTVAAGSGSLLQRIRRLLGSPATPDRSGWLAVGAIAFLVLVAFLATSRRSLFAAEANKVVAEAAASARNAPLLQFRLVAQQNDPSPGEEIPDPNSRVGNGRKLRVLKEVLLDESALESATLQNSLIDGRTEIAVTLTDAGAENFSRLTEQNVKRQLAIIFGGKILSAPKINEKIMDKHIALAGNFTRAEAEAIVAALNRALISPTTGEPYFRNPWKVGLSDTAKKADNASSKQPGLEAGMLRVSGDLVKTFLQSPEFRENRSLRIELTPKGLVINFLDDPSKPIFQPDSAEFTDYGKWVFNTVAWEIARYPATEIALEMHTKRGQENYGARELSLDRGKTARTRLLANGVKASQIRTFTGYGEEKPLNGKTAEDVVNDRITIVLSTDQLKKVEISTLVQDARLLIELGKLDEAEAKLEPVVKQDPEHTAAQGYLNYIKEVRRAQGSRGRKTDPDDNPIFPEERRLPLSKPVAQTNRVHTSPSRDRILDKLNRIILGEVLYDGIPLSDVIKDLNEKVRALDPDKRGINFIINSQIAASSTAGTVDSFTGRPIPVSTPEDPVDLSRVLIRINPTLRNVRLADVLDAITKVADKPLKYAVEDYAVVFTQRTAEAPQLFTGTFKVDPNRFFENLQNELGPPFHSPGDTLRHFLTHIGIDFPANQVGLNNGGGIEISGFNSGISAGGIHKVESETSKAVFMSTRSGIIFARATLEELNIMGKAIQALNSAPPQVMLDCKFAEITVSDSKAMGFHWLLGNIAVANAASPQTNSLSAPAAPTTPERTNSNDGKQKTNLSAATINGVLTGPQFLELVHSLGRYGSNVLTIAKPSGNLYSNGALATVTGVLTNWQFRGLLQALAHHDGVDVLSLPRVVTLSGHQAKMEVTDTKAVVLPDPHSRQVPPTDATVPGSDSTASKPYSATTVRVGPSVDVTPNVSEDGHSIQMTITANLVEFLGYDDPGPFRAADGSLTAVSPLPRFRIRQVISDATVRDGQTLVLSGFAPANSRSSTNNVPELGNIPMPGRFLSSDSSNKHLILFVTPTLIDPAGNPIHTENNRPFAPNSVPPQPARK